MGWCRASESTSSWNVSFTQGSTAFCGKRPYPLLWAVSRAKRGEIAVRGVSNRLNYCVMFIPYTQFTNVAAGRIIQRGGPRIGDHAFSPAEVTLLPLTLHYSYATQGVGSVLPKRRCTRTNPRVSGDSVTADRNLWRSDRAQPDMTLSLRCFRSKKSERVCETRPFACPSLT